MPLTSVQDLRRIAESIEQVKGHTVTDVTVRSDCRQLRVTLEDGRILLVSVLLDEDGRPRLDIDILRLPVAPHPNQLEVDFDSE